MSLDISKLQNVKRHGEIMQAKCPACAETGLDKSGNHLRIYPDGKFGCALESGNHDHRRRIWELCKGDSTEKPKFMPRPEPAPPPKLNVTMLMRRWLEQTSCVRLRGFADRLGVGPKALASTGCAWAEEHGAWAWPMRDGYGEPVGVRLRNEEGEKWAVRGSKQGLFTCDFPASDMAFVVEGPTDLAAMLTLGLWTVGRPSCVGGNEQLKVLFKLEGVKRAVIVSDNDTPGMIGAKRLSEELQCPCAVILLPCKDAREFVRAGGTASMLDNQLRETIWRNP